MRNEAASPVCRDEGDRDLTRVHSPGCSIRARTPKAGWPASSGACPPPHGYRPIDLRISRHAEVLVLAAVPIADRDSAQAALVLLPGAQRAAWIAATPRTTTIIEHAEGDRDGDG